LTAAPVRNNLGADGKGKGAVMIKVKTFTIEMKIFHARKELENLDQQVNRFFSENAITKVISVSDTCTTDDKGATMGIVRTVAYEQ
jgi:hypothetical protein